MPAPTPPSGRATRARYWVIVFAIILAIIQYVDRVAISQAMPEIAKEMGFTDAQKGAVFSAFALAYALFEIPTGWLGDRIGARKVLIRVVLWWSFFTAATGWAWNHASMVVTRFLFGAGEAGCFPNLTKAMSAWLPAPRADPRAVADVDGRSLGWRVHPAAGGGGDRFRELAHRLRHLRAAGRGVGGGLLPVVPRPPARPQGRERRRTGTAQGKRG